MLNISAIPVSQNMSLSVQTTTSPINDSKIDDSLKIEISKEKVDFTTRLFKGIDHLEVLLDKKIGTNRVQCIYDHCCDINEMTRDLPALISTPIKIIIIAPTYFLMHPIKFFLKVAKVIVALAQPESLIKIGGGLLGSSTATGLFTHGFSVLTFSCGTALTLSGISIGALKTMRAAEKNFKMKAVQDYLFSQAGHFTSAFIPSFFLVLTIESIHRLVRLIQTYGIDSDNLKQYFEALRSYMAQKYPGIEYIVNFDFLSSLQGFNQIVKNFKLSHFKKVVKYDVHESNIWDYGQWIKWKTVTPIFEDLPNFKADLTGFVPPPPIPFPPPYRLNDFLMNNIGGVPDLATGSSNSNDHCASSRET